MNEILEPNFQQAASLRRDAADILEMLAEGQRQDFQALSSPLELRFEEKCTKEHSRLQLKPRYQEAGESLQELVADIQRLFHLAFSDCPVETRQDLALMYFIDSVRDPGTQKALRLVDLKDIGFALFYAHKIEAAQQAARNDRHLIGAVSSADSDYDLIKQIEDLRRKIRSLEERKGGRNTKIQCWTCGTAGHIRRNCYWKPHFKVFQISTRSGDDNGLFVMGHVNKVPCRMIIDTEANRTIIRTDLARKLGEKLI